MKQVQEKHTKRKLRTSSASTVISISLVLFMLGILGLVLINAQRLSNYVKENIGFTVMLNEDVKEIEVNLDLNKEIKNIIDKQTNEQLNMFSNIYFNKLKKNIEINEF